MSLTTPDKIRTFQRKLYCKAKAEPAFRFYVLYDKICREDILHHAYRLARANAGAPGVDEVTFAQIEERGLEAWLAGLREELVSTTSGEVIDTRTRSIRRGSGHSTHQRLHPGRSRSARRPTRDHTLERRARLAGAIPKSKGGGRPHLHCRRPDMDLGRDGRGDRPGIGRGRTGSGRGRRPSRRQTARGLSPARRWPVAVFGAAGTRAKIRPYPERTGLCEAQSR